MNNNVEFIIGIRVTTSKIYGLGHITRCTELAKQLKYNVIFFIDPDSEINTKYTCISENKTNSATKATNALKNKKISALIFDNYNISKTIIEKISKIGLCLVIDDLKIQWKNPIVIAPNLGSQQTDYKNNQNVYAGIEYSMISNKFYYESLQNYKFYNISIDARILIQIGAVDSKNNINKILKILSIYKNKIKHITVVLSKKAPHRKNIMQALKAFNSAELVEVKSVKKMIKLYRENNLIIGASGVSLLERVSMGISFLAFSLNNNQDINLEQFKKYKLGVYGGRIDKISNIDLERIILKYMNENKSQYLFKNDYSEQLDGKGCIRVANIISEYISEKHKVL